RPPLAGPGEGRPVDHPGHRCRPRRIDGQLDGAASPLRAPHRPEAGGSDALPPAWLTVSVSRLTEPRGAAAGQSWGARPAGRPTPSPKRSPTPGARDW